MTLPELCIRRPVMTTLLMFAIILFGVMSYRLLPVSDLPNVDFPTILVSASLPGASPETMASAVATPLEKQFSTIEGLDSMTSQSAQGDTRITLQFNMSRSLDAAAQDVQAAISQATRQLPPDLPVPPSYRKVNPADQPVLYVALVAPTLPLSQIDEYAETLMAQRISMVSGVAQVQVFGSQKYAVRIQLDPHKLASMGIGIDQVAQAVTSGNVNLPTGVLWGSDRAFTVQATGQLNNAKAYRPLVVAYRDGTPVRLEQLGKVIDSVENDKVASWYNMERGLILAIYKQPGTNAVEVVDSISKILPALKAQMPASVKLDTLYDRSVSIRDSIRDIKLTLLLSLTLVVLVIFLFLRNLSTTVIPSLALPMSVIGTFTVMYLLGYSLDNLSLMALILSVGFVVDDAIVVLENIVRHTERGEDVMAAALKGSREIGFTILSMTLSLAAVFIPVLFLGGIMGRLLHEFSIVIVTAVLISGFVSLTLTPMLSSRFIKPPQEVRHGRLYKFSERFFKGMLLAYEWSLGEVLKHRRTVLIITIFILGVTVYLFEVAPKGFLPSEDTDQIFAFTEAAEGISYRAMAEHQREIMELVRKEPYVSSFMSAIGPSGISASMNTGRIFIRLKARSERPSGDKIIQDLRSKISIPGIKIFMQNLPPINIGGTLTKSQYQFALQSTDTEELYRYVPILVEKIRKLPGLQDVTSDLQIKNPKVNVEIDRDKAASLGVTAFQVENALNTAYSSRQVSTILAPNNEYQVIMELEPQDQLDPAALSKLYITSSSGKLVPIGAVASMTQGVGPLTVNHIGQIPAVTISFNLKPGVALSQAVDVVSRTARQTLPSTITASFQGTAQAFESSVQGLGILLILAILVIYIVLGILYESFVHPLTILSGLPAAGVGALVTLMLFKMELNLYGFVGIIMLVGIVKKNAIMMIDFALEVERSQSLSPAEAIYQGCLIRFRPIMMTTMAALMGTLPIALGFGAGAESRRSLGLAVVGGLLFSQLVTLYITPVLYTYLDSFQRKMGRLWVFRAKEVPGDDLTH